MKITLRTMENFLVKLKGYVDWLSLLGIGYICLYQVDVLREMCKAICQYAIDKFLFVFNIELIQIKVVYFKFESFFHAIIICSIIFSILFWTIKFFWDRWLKKQPGKNRFEQSLFRYLHTTDGGKCFLISGKWGSGKTYEVNKFFDKYYRFSNTPVYRISCFGLDSREKIVKEINSVIENNDHSCSAQIIGFLEYIPVVGEFLVKLLKKDYNYMSVPQNSIFIFDDFERLTSKLEEKKRKDIYDVSPFLLSDVTRGRNRASEFSEIKKEFENVSKAFKNIGNVTTEMLEKVDNDKYIAVVGLINDLIETYEMKVVIVCNSDLLGERFIHDVLRSKLNCVEYKKQINSDIKHSLLSHKKDSIVLDSEKKQERIYEFLDLVEIDLGNSLRGTKFDNMRLYSGIIEAFIYIANFFDLKHLTQEFMTSLLNSVIITHWAYYEDSVHFLDEIKNGMNIEFGIRCFGAGPNPPHLIRLENNSNEVKYVQPDISGYWIFNITTPTTDYISSVYELWEQYEYYDLEYRMIKNMHVIRSEENYDIIHVLKYASILESKDLEGWNYSEAISIGLSKYDLSDKQSIMSVLHYTYTIFRGRISIPFLDVLFDKLSERYSNEDIPEINYIYSDFVKYLREKKKSSKIV